MFKEKPLLLWCTRLLAKIMDYSPIIVSCLSVFWKYVQKLAPFLYVIGFVFIALHLRHSLITRIERVNSNLFKLLPHKQGENIVFYYRTLGSKIGLSKGNIEYSFVFCPNGNQMGGFWILKNAVSPELYQIIVGKGSSNGNNPQTQSIYVERSELKRFVEEFTKKIKKDYSILSEWEIDIPSYEECTLAFTGMPSTQKAVLDNKDICEWTKSCESQSIGLFKTGSDGRINPTLPVSQGTRQEVYYPFRIVLRPGKLDFTI